MKMILSNLGIFITGFLILMFDGWLIAQTPQQGPAQTQQLQRDQLTADAVFEGIRKDIGDCSIEKSTAQAALKVEGAYSKKLEARIRELEQQNAAQKTALEAMKGQK